jgi:hypothetical protein
LALIAGKAANNLNYHFFWINNALEKGLLVIPNATGTLLGYVINLYAQSQQNGKQINLSIKKCISWIL